jgi:hypothetical protein
MKRGLLLTCTVLAFAIPLQVFGQALTTLDYSTSLGTAAQQCVPSSSSRKTLFIEDPAGNSNNVGYCVASANGTCTPVIGSPGTSVLTPGLADGWVASSAPTGPVYCIGSGSSTPVTIRSGQ